MKVLIIEKDRDFLNSMVRLLNKHQIEVDTAFDGVQAIESINKSNYDLVISSLDIPRVSKNIIFEEIKKKDNKTKILVTTYTSFDNTQNELFDDFIVLPFDANEFIKKVMNN